VKRLTLPSLYSTVRGRRPVALSVKTWILKSGRNQTSETTDTTLACLYSTARGQRAVALSVKTPMCSEASVMARPMLPLVEAPAHGQER